LFSVFISEIISPETLVIICLIF